MKKIFILTMTVLTISGYSQKVSDILEHGMVVKDKEGIFLQLQTDKIFYETGKQSSGNFDPLKSETFFLIKSQGVNIYVSPPLNPLNYSSSIETTFQPDAINAAYGEALSGFLSLIENFGTQVATAAVPPVAAAAAGGPGAAAAAAAAKDAQDCLTKLNQIKQDFESLAPLLKSDKKSEIAAIFKSLKSLDFLDKENTKGDIDAGKAKRDVIDAYYKSIKVLLDPISAHIDAYEECSSKSSQKFINVYVVRQMLKDAQSIYQNFIARLSNLDKMFDAVHNTYKAARGTGKDWYIEVKDKRVSMQDDKVASSNVTINTDGYKLSEDNEIVKEDKKELVSTILKFRKFQRFVPEVSAGIAYTKLSFPKYTAETDAATGKLHVADAGRDEFKQMNFTSMINFNYYLRNSPLHPFWQIGIGANSDYPTLFTGIGLRLNVGLKRLAFSTGFAGTWIKTLQTLKVNGEVASDADLEKDLKHEFSFPLKPYIGLQFNF